MDMYDSKINCDKTNLDKTMIKGIKRLV